jgi:predicted amidohydrolase YtcJ
MRPLVIINGMIWDGVQKPFLGTLTCTNHINSVCHGVSVTIPTDAEVFDAKGGSVIPAFTDVHQHFSACAHKDSSKFVRLDGAHSLAEAINLLIDRSQTTLPGEWIIGTTLNHNQFTVRTLPTRIDLDAVPNPVLVTHQCGHSFFMNSLAISTIGESQFSNVEGVGRDSIGRMTGILEDGANAPLLRYFKKLNDECTVDWINAMNSVLRLGIAEVHAIEANIILAQEPVHVYESLRDSGQLSVRIRLYLTERPNEHSIEDDEWLSYGGHKIFVDGAFGGRTAAMREPFNDVNRRGVLCYTDDELYKCLKKTFECGLQLMVHVIGDRGLDQLLDVLEKLASEGVHSDWPIKLTHCELCHPEQIDRIARIGAFCDVQPGQLTSEVSFLPDVIGHERMQHCFPFRSMIDAGITIVGSSDAPVDPDNPLIGIHAAVVRHEAMNLKERISLHEALKMYTINAQKLIKNDHKKGLLLPGYLADIAVFEEDLFAVNPEKLPECKVAATIVNGKIAYRRDEKP